MTVVDLFAGPGGLDLGARANGIDPVGIEWEPNACATRAAAGLRTIRADLLTYGPDDIRGPLAGLLGSPPCPAFSAAGTGAGRAHLAALCEALLDSITDDHNAWMAPWLEAGAVEDPDTSRALQLLVSPLHWIGDKFPRWVVLEQVPPVLPFWETSARWLESLGYSTWAGVLNAADYGVPQTRRRAILLASLDRPASPPEPTHAREPQQTLFGDPVASWVTMADALGWSGFEVDTRCDARPDGSTQTVTSDRPPTTLTRKSVGQWRLRPGRTDDRNRCPYRLDEPAPTVAFGKDFGSWVWERPATTVTGDPRIWPPGHKINGDDIARLGEDEAARRYGDRSGTKALRLGIVEAAALQTFPAGYPWQGSKTAQAVQVGNAVPPLLATHLVRSVA